MNWKAGDVATNGTATGTSNAGRIFRGKVRNAPSKIQMLDASDWNASQGGANWQTRWDLFPEAHGPSLFGIPGFFNQAAYRHNEGANLLMFDSHVEYRTKAETFFFNADNSVNGGKNQDLWWAYK